jgi:type I restriction enzyme R subunit
MSTPAACSATTSSVYDIQQAVEDNATVPIYYESRLARLELDETSRPTLDEDLRRADRGRGSDLEGETQDQVGRSWRPSSARGTASKQVAADLVQHFENRLEAMDGKAMVVCMSRRICVTLRCDRRPAPGLASPRRRQGGHQGRHDRLRLRPRSGSKHIRNKARREELAKRFKNPDARFKIVIVRDMWLTGFDAPCCTPCMWTSPCVATG